MFPTLRKTAFQVAPPVITALLLLLAGVGFGPVMQAAAHLGIVSPPLGDTVHPLCHDKLY